jgi:hypothetical protein
LKRYFLPALIGFLLGLYALAIFAAYESPFSDLSLAGPMSLIQGAPHWYSQEHYSGRVLDLEHQAIFLRFCHLLVSQGFHFLVIPPFMACVLTKLQQLGPRFGRMWRFSVTLQITVCASVILSLCGCLKYSLGQLFVSPERAMMLFLGDTLVNAELMWFNGLALFIAVYVWTVLTLTVRDRRPETT